MKSGKIGLSADLEEYREAVVQAAKKRADGGGE